MSEVPGGIDAAQLATPTRQRRRSRTVFSAIAMFVFGIVALISLVGMIEARQRINDLERATGSLERSSADGTDMRTQLAELHVRVRASEEHLQQLQSDVDATVGLLDLAAQDRDDTQAVADDAQAAADDAASDASAALQSLLGVDQRLDNLESCIDALYGSSIRGCPGHFYYSP